MSNFYSIRIFFPECLLTIAVCLGVCLPSYALSVQRHPALFASRLSTWNPPNTTFKKGASSGRRRAAAGSRSCDPEILAILPSTTFGLVGVESPELLLYVASEDATSADIGGAQLEIFIEHIHTQRRSVLYRVEFEDIPRDRLFSLPWPSSIPLDLGQLYHWRFSLNCQPSRLVQGSLALDPASRSLTMSGLLTDATPLERAHFYMEQGWWYDSIKLLWQRQATEPEASLLWQQILEAEGY